MASSSWSTVTHYCGIDRKEEVVSPTVLQPPSGKGVQEAGDAIGRAQAKIETEATKAVHHRVDSASTKEWVLGHEALRPTMRSRRMAYRVNKRTGPICMLVKSCVGLILSSLVIVNDANQWLHFPPRFLFISLSQSIIEKFGNEDFQ